MDILSHGLWAVAVGTGATIERNIKFKARWLLFWGMFPDLFAFLPVISYSLVGRLFGIDFPFEPPTPGVLEPWTPGFGTLMDVTQLLYSFSHSLVVFLLVLLLFYAMRRHIPWVLLGWPLHILADVPTHTHLFFATPVFWPVSPFSFDGFTWGHGYFTLYNCTALIFVYLLLLLYTKFVLKKTTSRLFTW